MIKGWNNSTLYFYLLGIMPKGYKKMTTFNATATTETTVSTTSTEFNFISRRVALDTKGQEKLNDVLSAGLPETEIEFIDADDKVTTIDNAKFWRRLPYTVSLDVPSIESVLESELGLTKILKPLFEAHVFNETRAAFDSNLAISVPDSFTLSIESLIESLEPRARAVKAKAYRITNKVLKQVIESFATYLKGVGKSNQAIVFQVKLLNSKFDPMMLSILSDAQIRAISDNVLSWADNLTAVEAEELSQAIELLVTNLSEALALKVEVSADDL